MRNDLFSDKAFLTTTLHLAVPIVTQQLVMNVLNAVDVLMIGQLDETAVAAAGLANQIFFLLTLFLFGVGSGSAVFSAQFWGRGDVANLRRVLGIGLRLALAGGMFFTLTALAAPAQLLSFYTRDPAVIAAGSGYLRMMAFCYIPASITMIYGIILRSTRNVKLPMAVGVGALTLKTLLAYVLIFGKLGLPALGIMGGAIATVIARCLECAVLVVLSYRLRLPVAAGLRELDMPGRAFMATYARTTLPVIVGEIAWSLGITTYMAIYARISTEAIAAVNIASTIEGVALVPFLGLGNACAILLGNRIGANQAQDALRDARRYLRLTVLVAFVVGLLLLAVSGVVFRFYRISPEAQLYLHNLLLVIAGALWLKSANLIIIVGIMRSGGDTRFALFTDAGPMWFLGVPMAAIAAFVLGLPVYWVMLTALICDEGIKFLIGIRRVLSARWINNVVQTL
ncbi:MAG: MATE family efflux transporter [Anaerolineae bacterium]